MGKTEAALMKIVHIIPYDGIGGVEVAARSLPDGAHHHFEFEKYYLVDKTLPALTNGRHGKFYSENHPVAYLAALINILKLKPGIVIASLWRSCVVSIIIKAVRPKTRLVTFLHSATDTHWLDKLLNRLAMRLSAEIWADSSTTLEARVPKDLRPRSRIISFLVDKKPEPVFQHPNPRFVFWGRLHFQKDLIRALKIFARVSAEISGATFYLIGPDGGQRKSLENEVSKLGLDKSVFFLGPLDRTKIFEFARTCSFYLQTSLVEGMAMSVIEAMQLGLVPVVTPAGEISRYCQDSYNAILVKDESEAANKVIELFKNGTLYLQMSRSAFATWQSHPLYCDDVISACRQLAVKSH